MTDKSLRVLRSESVRLSTGLLMATLWFFFAYRHVIAFQATGALAYLLMCVSETLTAIFFMTRSPPVSISDDPLDWLVAFAGTFTPLLFFPAPWGILPGAWNLIVLGTALQILGLASLNMSFALVAARRQVKTTGMYRFVRHPLYASYLIVFTGYVLANTSAWNVSLYFLTMALLALRMVREERHLSIDPAYMKYMQDVPYRVIPFVY